ncbi:hypothetical protein [Streptomyces sp. NPDC002550]
MSELYRLIHAETAAYPIVLLCRVLMVARSSYYAWCEGEVARCARQAADDALAHEITVLHIASRHTRGDGPPTSGLPCHRYVVCHCGMSCQRAGGVERSAWGLPCAAPWRPQERLIPERRFPPLPRRRHPGVVPVVVGARRPPGGGQPCPSRS